MDPRDRKRVFSNAFDPSNYPAPKVSRTMAGCPASAECSSSPSVCLASTRKTEIRQTCTHNASQLPALLPLGSPSPSDPDAISNGGDVFGCYSRAEPAMCKERSDEGRLGPPVLGLEELSLHDGPKTLVPNLHQSRMTAARTSAFIVESDSLKQ